MIKCIVLCSNPEKRVVHDIILKEFPCISPVKTAATVDELRENIQTQKTELIYIQTPLDPSEPQDHELLTELIGREIVIICRAKTPIQSIDLFNHHSVFVLSEDENSYRIRKIIGLVIERINEQRKHLLIENSQDYYVKIDDIVFIKAQGAYSTFHFSDKKTFTSSKNLGYYESILPTNMFFRIHNSIIVNFKYLSRIEKSAQPKVHLTKGFSPLPISARKAKLFFQRYRI